MFCIKLMNCHVSNYCDHIFYRSKPVSVVLYCREYGRVPGGGLRRPAGRRGRGVRPGRPQDGAGGPRGHRRPRH